MADQGKTKRRFRWGYLVTALVLVASGAFIGSTATKAFNASPLSATSVERNRQIVRSITREEQVVLLALGIQGIQEKTGKTKFFGVDIPGSDRASFLMYTFDAKLGIEGKDVQVRVGDANTVFVTMPKFIFIGHDNHKFRIVAENNGVLSWVTPENDPVEMINNILTDQAKAEYVKSNEEFLKEQAKAFYSGIITSIDPDVTVEFEFRN